MLILLKLKNLRIFLKLKDVGSPQWSHKWPYASFQQYLFKFYINLDNIKIQVFTTQREQYIISWCPPPSTPAPTPSLRPIQLQLIEPQHVGLSHQGLSLWGLSLESFCLQIFLFLSRQLQTSMKPCFHFCLKYYNDKD